MYMEIGLFELCVFERLSRGGAVCVVADVFCSGIIACLKYTKKQYKIFRA